MLIGIIKLDNLEHATQQIIEAYPWVDVFELRLDFYEDNMSTLSAWRKTLKKPIVLTLRTKRDGGENTQNPQERIKKLKKIAQLLQPEYIDIEHHAENKNIEEIKQLLPSIKIIRSYHNLSKTPENLDNILVQMQHHNVDIYKIVPTAKTTHDALRLLSFLRNNKHKNIIAHSMGEKGFFSRILSLAHGSKGCYINATKTILKYGLELKDIQNYHLKKITIKTKCYALLGDPIHRSPGHVFHNHEFLKSNKDAIYVKISVSKENLKACWHYLSKLNFYGFSITIPLKQSFDFLVGRKSNQAINTLSIKPSIQYTNTDGKGALAALRHKVGLKNKTILLLGYGGTCTGIMEELSKLNTQTIICGRNKDKAAALAKQYAMTGISFEELNKIVKVDIIISTLPPAAYKDYKITQLIEPLLIKQPTVMDVVYYPKDTPLLAAANERKCQLVYGNDMFQAQAKLQQLFWNATDSSNN